MNNDNLKLILYSKPGCHLCEGLEEKLDQIIGLAFELEIRDITTQQEWMNAYQYEIPVLFCISPGADTAIAIPRFSPRAPIAQVERVLRRYI